MGLDLIRIVAATRLPGVKMDQKCYKGEPPFQGADIYLRFDLWLIRLACPAQSPKGERFRGAGFNRID